VEHQKVVVADSDQLGVTVDRHFEKFVVVWITARFTVATPLKKKTAEETNRMMRVILGSLPQPARRDMPRKTQTPNYTDRDIDELARAINSTTREYLELKTPAETLLDNLNRLHLRCESSFLAR
jgi:IS30 family transposase